MNPASVSDTIVQEITINGSANRIFDALTDPDQRVKWWGAELEEKNGVTTVRLTHSGLTSETSRISHKGWPQILTWLRAYVETPA